jgi:hypothetical protein
VVRWEWKSQEAHELKRLFFYSLLKFWPWDWSNGQDLEKETDGKGEDPDPKLTTQKRLCL